MRRYLHLFLLLLFALCVGNAAAQSTTISKWTFGSGAFSRDATTKSALISTSPFNLNNSVITLNQASNSSGNTGFYGSAGNWTSTATNNTSARTSLAPRTNTKSLYANFTIRPEATGDFSNLTMSFNYQRTASSAPTKVRAFLTWQNGTTYYTRYSSLISLSSTTSTTAWTTASGITFNTGATQFPSGTALANKNFLLEIEFSTVSNTTNSINVDDITLTANSLCSNVTIGTSGTLPGGTRGVAYSQTPTVSGGIAPYSWSVVSGYLPPGVTLNTSTGQISGTPQSWGDFDFTLRASDSVGCFDDADYIIPVAAPAGCGSLVEWDFSNYSNGQTVNSTSANPIQPSYLDPRVNATGIVSPSGVYLYGGSAGCFYSLELGAKTISFTVGVPAGSTTAWDIADLLFDFQAETASPTSMHIEVAKWNPATSTYDKFYTTNSISVPHYSLGFAHYRHSVTTGTVGPGVLDTRINPGETFKYSLVAEGTVTNASMDLSGVQLLGCPVACPTITVTPASASSGQVGVAYSMALAASGGTAPYTWSTVSGALPAGLTLNTSSGLVSGTPTAGGTSTATIRATGTDGCSSSKTYSVTIASAPLSVGNLVWQDNNNTGRFETGEGVANVVVQLYNTGNTLVASTTTNTSGLYRIDNLAPGTYYLKIPASEFASGKPLYQKWSLPGYGLDDDRDDDWDENGIDDTNPATNGIKTANFTLASGAEATGASGREDGQDATSDDTTPGDSNCDLTKDFGFVSCNSVNLVSNNSFENGSWSNTATFITAPSYSRLTSNSNSGITDWTFDKGAWIDDATHASHGNRAVYITGSGTCVWRNFRTPADTVSSSYMSLTPGKTYVVQFDWAPFLHTDQNATSGTLGGIHVDMGWENTSWSGDQLFWHKFDFVDLSTGLAIANPRALTPWTNLGWRRCRTVLTLPPPPSGMERGFIAFSQISPPNTGLGVMLDNVVISELCPPLDQVAVGNVVYKDTNYNGRFDSGEGLDGVELHLYRETDLVTAFPLQKAWTTAGGRYSFAGLVAGRYYVRIPPSEFGTGKALNGLMSMPGTAADNEFDDNVAYADNGIDNSAPATNGIISNVFTLSVNNEPTNADTETGYGNTSDDDDDDNADMTIDFGFQSNPVGLGNLVFIDTNNNGKYDAGEGVGGVTVQLKNTSGTVLSTTTTSTNGTETGRYQFFGIAAGSYIVSIPASEFASGEPLFNQISIAPVTPTDDSQDDSATTGDSGIDNASPAVNGISSPTIALTVDGEVTNEAGFLAAIDDVDDNNYNLTVDFGFKAAPATMTIGNLVWEDTNNNGIKDPAEVGLAGALVELYSPGADNVIGGSSADSKVGSTITTPSSGSYLFTGLAVGNYYVKVTAPVTHPITGGTVVTLDNNVDGDNNGAQSGGANTPAYSPVINLAASSESTTDGDTDANTNLTVDFGFAPVICSGTPVLWLIDEDRTLSQALHLWSFDNYDLAISTAHDYGRLKYTLPSDSTVRDIADGGDIESMAVNSYTGQAYILSSSKISSGPSGTQSLWTYNLLDAEANKGNIVLKLIGHITRGTSSAPMECLAFDPNTNRLYTADPKDTSQNSSNTVDKLYYINIASLNANPMLATPMVSVGDMTGLGYACNYCDGLEMTTNGKLYAVDGTDDHLYEINPATGAIVALADSQITGGIGGSSPDVETIAWDYINNRMIATDNSSGHRFIEVTIGSNGANVLRSAFLPGTPGLHSGADFEASGFFNTCPPQPQLGVGNLVYKDTNFNGKYDTGEGADGVTVYLFAQGQDPLTHVPAATTVTANGGNYGFTRLSPGNYFVHIPPSNFALGKPLVGLVSALGVGTGDDNTGEDGVDNATPATNGISSGVIALTDGGEPTNASGEAGFRNTDDDADDNNTDLTVDFGFQNPSAAIGNLVWNDANRNGIKDASETGISNVTVKLYTSTDLVVGNADDALYTGSINTVVTAADGSYVFSGLTAGKYFVEVTPPTSHPLTGGTVVTADNSVNNDNNGSQPGGVGAVCRSPVITLTLGGESITDGDTDPSSNLTVDFGLFSGFTVGDLVWNDADNDGAKDAAESGIGSVTVELLSPGADNAIGGTGSNADTVVASTSTNLSGNYAFTVFTAGKYYVRVTPTNIYPQASAVVVNSDNGVDNDSNGTQIGGTGNFVRSPVITLAAGLEPGAAGTTNIENTIDFGLRNPGNSIGDTVWSDTNNDGVRDVGEAGISGLRVELWKPGADNAIGGADDTQTGLVTTFVNTDASGQYTFAGLSPGKYYIKIPTPPTNSQASSSVRDSSDNQQDNDNNGAQASVGAPVYSPVIDLATGAESIADGDLDPSSDMTVDFGFVGSTDYGDNVAFGSASSTANGVLKLGANLDVESTENLNATATGDDSIGLDDEDGVTIPTLMQGKAVNFTVNVTNTTGAPAFLNAWIDYNKNGVLTDAGELVISNISIPDGTVGINQTYAVTAPTTASGHILGVRFRLTTVSAPSPVGFTTGFGEVEDYVANICPMTVVSSYNIIGTQSVSVTSSTTNVGRVITPALSMTSSSLKVGTGNTGVADAGTTAGMYSLAVQNTLSLSSSSIRAGAGSVFLSPSITYTGSNFTFDAGAGSIVTTPAPSFASIFAGVTSESAFYTTMTANSTATVSGSDLTLTAGSTVGTGPAVFNVTIAQLTAGHVSLNSNGQNPSAWIVNVSGAGNATIGSTTIGSEKQLQDLVLNFYQSTGTITIDSTTMMASVLAPQATITVNSTTKVGSIAGKIINIISSTIGYPTFGGAVCPGEVGVGNLVWKDANGNGTYEAGEGVDGVTVKLFNVGDVVTGAAVATTTTAGGGLWSITGLNPGHYFVHIPASNFLTGAPLLSTVSLPGANLLDNGDHGIDAATPSVSGISSGSFNLAPNSQPTDATGETGAGSTSDNADDDNTNLTIDFAFQNPQMSIGNLVWNDVDNDGTKDASESGIANVPVELWNPGADNAVGGTGTSQDTLVKSAVLTSAAGAYSFTGLAAGNYFVKVSVPPSYPYTSGTPVTTDNNVDNNNDGSQPGGKGTAIYSPVITLQPSTESTTDGDTDANTNMTVDFGLFAGFTVGDLVFNDANDNGIKDGTEAGISGVTVDLVNNTTSAVVATATTNASGIFSLVTATPGTYKVRVTPASGYPLASTSAGTDNGTNNNNDGTQPSGQGTASTSFVFTLAVGTEPGSTGTTNTENTIDFGFRVCPTITLGSLTTNPTTGVLSSSAPATSGGVAPYSYSLASGSLPTWASLSPTTGAVSGTPNSTVASTFTLRATDSKGCSGTQSYTITPVCQTVSISPTALTNGTLNLAYNASMSASGGTAAYQWSTIGTWPAGISMNGSGVVSGTPTAVTSGVNGASVAVRATDANGCVANSSVNIKICPTLTLTAAPLPTPTVGSVYNTTITQTGSSATPIAWSATGLPSWLSLSPTTGVLTGTPTTTTTVNFTIIATDANGCAGSRAYSLTPVCPTVAIGGTLPSTATQTLAYGTQTLTASGGVSPYTWTVSSGTLPAGLTLTSGVTATTATVSGTPSTVEAQTFTIRAADANGCATTMTATITVSAPPMSIGNLVWNDVNNNGVKDAAEVGISGLTVQLFNPGGDNLANTGDDTQVGTNTTTSATGGYSFTNLAPGKYFVKVTPNSTYPITSGTPATTDNDVDNNNDGSQPGGLNTAVFSPVITLTAGGESTTDGDTNFNTNFTVDFGLFTGILVGDTVFNDVNFNGVKDAGDNGISGLTVELLNGGTNAVLATTTTNGSGSYAFTVYTAGSYKVRVTPNGTFPVASPVAGADNATNDNNDGTQATAGGASTSFAFTLTPGAEPGTTGTTNTENTIDFGFFLPTTDFGDFATFADASSTASATIKVGTAATDTEFTANKNAAANGDDTTGADDEDGVTFGTLRQAQPGTATVTVNNTSAAPAYLNVWFDWNNNGTLEAGEQVASNVAIAAGTTNGSQTVNFTVPATATVGTVGARFRFTDVQTPGATGSAGNGEVEDHLVTVLAANTDFGDFSGFPAATSIANSTIKLGALAGDTEAALTPNAGATADDTNGTDDEDGVTFPAMTAGQTVNIPVTVTNTSGALAYLNAWIDWNNNGSVDAGEQIASNVQIANGTSGGTQSLAVNIPASAVTTSAIGARFRLTTVITPGFGGAAGNGEVEDYAVTIQSPITDFGDFSGFADAFNNATSALRMGSLVDSEYSSSRDSTATGDDIGGTDDEDGVTLPSMTAGQTVNVQVIVTNTTGAAAFLNAWIDYNNNGAFDAGEQIATNTNVANGQTMLPVNINVVVPTTATTGVNLGARFRLTAAGTPGPTGGTNVAGEVEDYVINIAAPTTDFGDFQTFGSASSTASNSLKLGALVDAEYAQTVNLAATGDNITGSNDEDGVTLPSLTAGQTLNIPVVVTNNTGAGAFLSAWIDFNNNGTLDASDQIMTNVPVNNGLSGVTQNISVSIPTNAITGVNVGARFRLTSVNTTAGTGASGLGEVEDYVVNIAAPTTDFGDFSGFADASNGISANLKLGATTDAEFSATKTSLADGDDTSGSDDEDGVTISSLTAGAPGSMTVTVTNNTGAVAYLNAWIDYNNNGTFDGGELLANNVNIANLTTNGTQTVNFTVPAGAVTGVNLGVRVRLTSTTTPGPTGTGGGSGEVEDYVVTIAAPTTDFGDFQNFGSASSTANSALKLGALVDTEYVQTVNLAATGDNITGSNDEDGVTMPSLTAGGPATIPVIVTNNTGADAYLNAWIDFNNNGTLDAAERIASNIPVATGTTGGTQNLGITVPANAVTGLNLGARFRLTSVNTTSGTGTSGIGEVEDYIVNIATPTTDFGDFSGFGDASNGISPNIRIGATTDGEFVSTRNTAATGDDSTGSDDEDGVTITSLTAGGPGTMTVTVTNTTGAAAFLNAWIDYNNNGVLTDSGEAIANNVNITNGASGIPQVVNFTVPATALTGTNLGVRVRLTSTTTPGSTGALGGSGEVEDYVVSIAVPTTDLGDFSAFSPASSTVNGNLKLGAVTDTEYAQTANSGATGDDITGVDDEDAVMMPALMAGAPATIPVIVTNNTGATAYLNAWIDFNNNGTLEAGEQIAANVPVNTGTAGGTQNIDITVPGSAVTGLNIGARFRLTDVNTTTGTGISGIGEVEDYVVNISAPPSDFGDFQSFADASSAATTALRMGALVDTEFVSAKNTTATADDNAGSDDEDGVTLPSMVAGAPATIGVVVTNTTGAVAYLNAWMDFNNNGTLEAGERIASDINIATATNGLTQNINFTVPATTVTGATLGLRFRLTSTITPGATGSSGSGEVEDYVATVAAPTTDFGDVAGYSDAWSTATSNLRIGSLADTEFVSTLNAGATGDDTTGSDDEDGVTVPASITLGAPGSITVNVTNTTGAVAYLNAWIDYNRNGSFADSGEQIAANVNIANNTNGLPQTVNFTVPVGATTGTTGVRVRFTNSTTTTSVGASGSGEVEDNVTNIVIPTTDFGDITGTDASSIMVAGLKMGAAEDTEYVSTKNAGATGDDSTGTDDEDGVTMPTTVNTGATVTIPVTVTNTTGSQAYLSTWVDFNGNGSFADAGEQVVAALPINNGLSGTVQNVTFTVPTTASIGSGRGVRFRLTSVNTTGPTGASGNGEVEDYTVAIAQGIKIGNLVWSDVNSNGTKDASEPILDGVTVQLYTPGGDATVNTGDDVLVNTTTTSGGGIYTFAGLSAGDYFVKVTPPSTNQMTGGTPATTDNNVDNNNDGAQPGGIGAAVFSPKINLALAAESITDGDTDANTNMTVDFGLFSGIQVGDLVFNDANNNGLYDSGSESGISGLTVELLHGGTNAVITSTTTNASGAYGFTVFTAGSYKVRVTPNGALPLATTAVNLDNGVNNDSNGVQLTQGTAATSAAFTLTAGGEPGTGGTGNAETTIDFGFRTCPTITVNPTSLSDGFMNTLYSQTVTATGGIGTIGYSVSVGTLPAWATLNPLSGLISGTPNAVGTTNFTIRATDSVGCIGTRAFTITVRSLRVGNLVWSDTNNNGVKDTGEPGLAGITVELWSAGVNGNEENGGGDDSKIVTDVVTNASGIYTFSNVPAGSNYYVRLPTVPVTNFITAGVPVTSDNGIDNDNNGQQSAIGAAVRSPKFALTGGAEPAAGVDGDDTDGEMTIDIGLAQTVGVGNLVFKDVNNNGFYESGTDTVVDGVTLKIFASGADPLVDTPVATTTSAGGGLYGFFVLPGSYFVYVPGSQFDAGGPLENTRPSIEPNGVPVVDDNGDQNALATAKPVVTGVSTGVFSLAVGTEPITATGETGFNASSDSAYDTSADLTIDLGFYPMSGGGFPLGGRVSRDLTALGNPTSSTTPLSGVEVALYSDTNGNGVLDTEEMAAVETAVTNEDGTFSFDAQPAGEYLVVQTVPTGSQATYDTDGGDPATTSVTVTNAAVKDLEFLQAACPDTFAIWQSQHALGGDHAAGDNPDGDLASNLLEYALGTSPDSGAAQRKFWLEANASGGIDAVLVRTTTGHLDVAYSIEGSSDLVNWAAESITPVIRSNSDGTETVRYADVSSPFVRLKVALDADHNGTPEATATSATQGWHREAFAVGQQTFSMPLLRDGVFAGTVSSVEGNVLTGINPALVAGTACYAEVISGALEGRRYEIDVAGSTSAGVSLASTPPAELAGSRVVVRPHWTVGALFPAADFHATNSSKSADRVMFFDAAKQSYRVLWLYASTNGPRWVRDGDATLADAATTVVGPSDAVIVQPRTAPVSGLFIGQVRSWKFVVSLLKGSQFVGGGFPVSQSPADRSMTSGFTVTTEASDRFQLWKGDSVSGATGYDSYRASAAGAGVIWLSEAGDDSTATDLFGAFRGVFISAQNGTEAWVQPVPTAP